MVNFQRKSNDGTNAIDCDILNVEEDATIDGDLTVVGTITGGAISGPVGPTDVIEFNTGAGAPSHAEGKLYYDATEHTLGLFNDQSAVTHQLGQEGYIRVYNNSGSLIADGKPVYISGTETTEYRPTIALARADALATSEVIGVTTMDIADNSYGYITYWGIVNDVDTSSFSSGDTLYLDNATAGEYTNIPPTSGFEVQIGFVIRSDASAGKILISLNQNLLFEAGEASEVTVDVVKGSAGTINAFELVYLDGYSVGQGAPEVELADASSSATMPAFGIMRESCTNSSTGSCVVLGSVLGINTSSFSVGDSLYVSGSTPGAYTNTKPTGTNLIQKIGTVTRSNPSQGAIQISGANRSNDLPNLPNNNIWVGNASAVPTETSTNTGFNLNLGTSAGTVLEGDHATTTSGIHGVTGNVVGTSDSQTLTNKTLTNPIINEINATSNLTLNPTGIVNFNKDAILASDQQVAFNGSTNAEYTIKVMTGTPFPWRFSGSSDGSVNRHMDVGYYNSNDDTLTWNSRFDINTFTGDVTGAGSINIASGQDYQINSTSVLNATTLGSAVVTSSLTTVGALNSGSISTGFGEIDNNGDIKGTHIYTDQISEYTAAGVGIKINDDTWISENNWFSFLDNTSTAPPEFSIGMAGTTRSMYFSGTGDSGTNGFFRFGWWDSGVSVWSEAMNINAYTYDVTINGDLTVGSNTITAGALTIDSFLTINNNTISTSGGGNDITLDPNATGDVVIASGEIKYGATDLKNVTETLTNKTISGSSNTITNIGDSSLSSGIDAAKIADGTVSNTEFQYINSLTSNAQTQFNNIVDGTTVHTGFNCSESDDVYITSPGGWLKFRYGVPSDVHGIYYKDNAPYYGLRFVSNSPSNGAFFDFGSHAGEDKANAWASDFLIETDATTGDTRLKLDNNNIFDDYQTLSSNVTSATGLSLDASQLADGTVSNTEFQYINSVTSNVQDQIDNIVSGTTNFTSNITVSTTNIPAIILEDTTAGNEYRLEFNDNGGTGSMRFKDNASSVAFEVTPTLGYFTGSRSVNIDAGNSYKINNTDVITGSSLGSGVTSSSLTSVGALNSGSITSGFGEINNGSSNITTTGTVSAGTLTSTGTVNTVTVTATSTVSTTNLFRTSTNTTTNASTISTADYLSYLETNTAGAKTMTLANGTHGQEKFMVCKAINGDIEITPSTTWGSYTKVVLTAVGQSCKMFYDSTYGWAIQSVYGGTVS